MSEPPLILFPNILNTSIKSHAKIWIDLTFLRHWKTWHSLRPLWIMKSAPRWGAPSSSRDICWNLKANSRVGNGKHGFPRLVMSEPLLILFPNILNTSTKPHAKIWIDLKFLGRWKTWHSLRSCWRHRIVESNMKPWETTMKHSQILKYLAISWFSSKFWERYLGAPRELENKQGI